MFVQEEKDRCKEDRKRDERGVVVEKTRRVFT